VHGRIRTTFLCANCEDDFDGFPSGARNGDQRPLCERCTYSGVEEGTAYAHDPMPVSRPLDGLKTVGYFAFAIFATALIVIFLCVQRVFR